jgi:hypothetical protein
MAEAAHKESKGSRRYGKGPKITEEHEVGITDHGQALKKGEGGHGDAGTRGASKSESKTDAKGEPEKKEPPPEGSVAAGDEAVPVEGQKSSEFDEMMDRHESERKDMFKRHRKEMKKHLASADEEE